MNWIKNTATVLGSILVALIAAELLFRLFGVGYGNTPLERSRVYHHAHPSNYSFRMHDPRGEFGGYDIFYDEDGYRVGEASSRSVLSADAEQAIVVMGDSFTEANQVDYDKTYSYQLGEVLQVPTLNLGVSSYSPLLYLLQVKKQVLDLKAPLVVLQVYVNDFSNDKEYVEYARYGDDGLEAVDGGENSLFITVARQSYLLRFIRKSQVLIQEMIALKKKAAQGVVTDDEALMIEQLVPEEELLTTCGILGEIDTLLASRGKQLVVFFIPSRVLSNVGKCCGEDQLYQRFVAQMRSRNIAVADIAPYFKAYQPQQDLFFNQDIHLTDVGNRVLAQAIAAELRTMDLVE